MSVPEYQQILFEDDNPIVPLGPMVERNVSGPGWMLCFKYISFVTCVLLPVTWYLYVWNQNGLPFISRRYNTRLKQVSEVCDKWDFLMAFSSYCVITVELCHHSLLRINRRNKSSRIMWAASNYFFGMGSSDSQNKQTPKFHKFLSLI